MVRIVHVNDVAGQASAIRYHMRHSHPLQVVVSRIHGDPFLISDQYQFNAQLPNYPRVAAIRKYDWHLWWQSRKADIIHAHGITTNSARRSWIMRRVLAGKKFILHYHGSDMRTIDLEQRRWFEEHAVAVLCSTPDLLADEFGHAVKPTLIHTMVNPKPFEMVRAAKNNRGLCCLKQGQLVGDTLDFLADNGYRDVHWQFVRRTYEKPQPDDDHPRVHRENHNHMDMPWRLSQYEYFADVYQHDGTWLDTRSIAGIEAALAGCKVVDIHGKIHGREIASEHLPVNVIPKIQAIYDRIM